MIKPILIAGLGGFIGTVLRFIITRYIQFSAVSVFPWGTFVVNLLGSLLLGIVFGLSEKGNLLSPEWRIFLTVGICGGFTTFSSFSLDAYVLLQSREILRMIIYASFSFALGLLAVFAGRSMIKLI
ncbi:MAG: fluoride efflux transporter CrcB [Bacteroidales bacterium]|nr:fluoride efflux transporter CrcB [Bacteroidales bacterium]MDD2322412.1 fluoride efflux transporter CrcB [Bacteroidales bacterium]MDD3011313.1 fluoride efflux transporter CrcB [Bacteroidales bacterium]MDD3961009.1 fluoride efflux transporter CrcB [Bacteroidales bacterium]MDY0284596.1 fluoride efflux transporter CrcB [Bacteroidales bacterium]